MNNSQKDAILYSNEAFLSLFSKEERKNMIKQKEEQLLLKYGISKIPYCGSFRYYKMINGKKYRRTDLMELLADINAVQIHTLNNMWEEYIKSREEHRGYETVRKDISTYNLYIKDSEIAEKDIKELTVADIKDFFVYCQRINNGKFTRKYWNGIKRVISTILSFAIDKGWLESNITLKVRFENHEFKPAINHKKEELFFNDRERRAIIDKSLKMADEDPLYYGLALLFCIGVRIGELCAIKWSDIDFTTNMIHVHSETTNGGKIFCDHTKTPAGDRHIPLNSMAIRALKAIKNHNQISGIPVEADDFIFLYRKKGTVRLCLHRVFEYRLYHMQYELGYTIIRSLHDIRRTYATNCYKKGMDIDLIREYMGHTTVEQTRAYIKDGDTSESQAREILEEIC